MRQRFTFLILFLITLHFTHGNTPEVPNHSSTTKTPPASIEIPANKWEKEISAFEAADKEKFPPLHQNLFVGSSSIRLWKTISQDLSPHLTINRGFGGSQIADSVKFFKRIVLPYQPKRIFFYAGTNDLASKKTVESVKNDFLQFLALVDEHLPQTHVYCITLSPAPIREKLWQPFQEFNRFVMEESQKRKKLSAVDFWNELLTPEGKAREELYVKDRLHFNEKGYQIWTSKIKALLDSENLPTSSP